MQFKIQHPHLLFETSLSTGVKTEYLENKATPKCNWNFWSHPGHLWCSPSHTLGNLHVLKSIGTSMQGGPIFLHIESCKHAGWVTAKQNNNTIFFFLSLQNIVCFFSYFSIKFPCHSSPPPEINCSSVEPVQERAKDIMAGSGKHIFLKPCHKLHKISKVQKLSTENVLHFLRDVAKQASWDAPLFKAWQDGIISLSASIPLCVFRKLFSRTISFLFFIFPLVILNGAFVVPIIVGGWARGKCLPWHLCQSLCWRKKSHNMRQVRSYLFPME